MSLSTSSPVMVDTPCDELITRLAPASRAVLASHGLSEDVTMVELSCGSELYELWSGYIMKHSDTITSYSLRIGRDNGEGDDEGAAAKRTVKPDLGLGLHKLTSHDGKVLYALKQTLGSPVGSDCGATMYMSMVIISPVCNDIEYLCLLTETLVREADKVLPNSFTCWRWHQNYCRWMRGSVANARPIESVVLPQKIKDTLLEDIDDFLSRDTRGFYQEHGIPYKRSYLFHGAPGAGKTSAIQALAGRYGRNVCYLSANPEMTDDSLKAAVENVPHRSIIVLEDVDALFDKQREKKDAKSVLTFSGLLNALDGVGGCIGQIFILTTNHRERLDPALIRNGRVDVHIEFHDANTEQIRGLFRQFYKAASPELADDFESALRAKLGERSVSMAALQGFFVSMRRSSPEEAIGSVGKIVTELDERANRAKERAAQEEAKNEQGTQKQCKNNTERNAEATNSEHSSCGGTSSSSPSGESHIHVHVHKN